MTEQIEANYKLLLLSSCYLFADLSIDELNQLVRQTRIRSAGKNEVIFKKNDKGNEMFVIAEGKVALTSTSDNGREISFGELSAGDIFGEISLFDNQERTATITAIEPTCLLVLSKEPFIQFILQNPNTTLKMLAAMAARLRYTDQIYEDVMFGPLGVRLARKIQSLAKIFGAGKDNTIHITVRMTPEEIAKMLGAALEPVEKQLHNLTERGLIAYQQETITIVDEQAFNKFIEKG